MLLVVFVVLLIAGFGLLGHSLFASNVDRYYSDIPDAAGITEGTPVLMAGVDVGSVTRIQLLTPRMARLSLDLKHGTVVLLGSELIISSSLIGLGQTPVTIQPPDRVTSILEPKGETLPGRREGPFEGMLPNGKQTIKELTETVTAVRKLLEDQDLKIRVKGLMASTQQTMDKFGKLAAEVSSTIDANRSNIGSAIVAATRAIEDVHRLTMRVADLVNNGKLKDRADGILAQIQTIEKHTDDLVGNLNKLVSDPALRRPAAEIARNVAQITETGKSIAAHTDTIVRNGEEISKNGIEISKNVATVSQKAVTLTDQANQIATNAIDIENRFKGALDKVGNFFDHAPSTKGFKLESEVDLMRQTNPGIWRTDITFDTPIPDGTLYAGVYDAFEANRFTIEVGHPMLQGAQYRYGIYASKPAIGVDFPLAKRLYLRGDLWDINNPQLTLRARYDFGGGLSGWLGVDHILHENTPTIGVGIVR